MNEAQPSRQLIRTVEATHRRAILNDLDSTRAFGPFILRYFNAAERTPKEELANGIRRKLTRYRLQSRPLWVAATFSSLRTDYETPRRILRARLRSRSRSRDAHTRAIEHL